MSGMNGPQTGRLGLPGASLHYQVTGSGPPLLLLPGGDGDANAFDGMSAWLSRHYTLISHDRRGLARSPLDVAGRVGIETHGDDAARLLAAVVGEPAIVFGTSLGGLIALDLAARHADQVRAVLAHEPPDAHLLPTNEMRDIIRMQVEVLETYRREGAVAAMKQFAVMVCASDAVWEADAPRPERTPAREANLNFFLANDADAVLGHALDVPALARSPVPIVPLVGRESGGVWTYRALHLLAARLGREPKEMPGGHNGPVNQPQAFAAELLKVLEALSD